MNINSKTGFLLIIILSGCANYKNIPRQLKFFAGTTEISFPNKYKKVNEINNEYTIPLKATSETNCVLFNDANTFNIKSDSQIQNFISKPETFLLNELTYRIKNNSSSVYKKIPASFSKKKLYNKTRFPLILIILGGAIILMGILLGIGYYTEKLNDSRPVVIPEKHNEEIKKKKKNGFAISATIVLIISFLTLIASLLLLMFVNYIGMVVVGFVGLLIGAILLIIGGILGAIALLKKAKTERQNKI